MSPDHGILLLLGNDEFAISRRLREARAVFQNASAAEMNVALLDARTMTEDQWSNAVSALPFLAAQRLVILEAPSARFVQRKSAGRGVEARSEADVEQDGDSDPGTADAKSAAGTARTSTAQARTRFLESLDRVPPTTRLIMWELGDPKDAAKHWLAKWMRQKHMPVEVLARPNDKTMASWIMGEAKAQGGEFSPPAATELVAQVGSDTRQASQEVTKLLTYVNWERAVTPADVRALTPRTAEAVIWNLVDALAAGNGHSAQELLHRFLEDDEQFYVWSMIIRQFRLMLLAREVLDAGDGLPEAMKALHSAEYPAKKALEAARRLTMRQLEDIYHRLLEIDEDAKTGGMPLEVSLDVLVAELTQT